MHFFAISRLRLACLLLAATAHPAWSFTFGNDSVTGSFDSTLTTGFGKRMSAPSPSLILEGNSAGPAGQQLFTSGLGDQGNLNYRRGDDFTQYLKGSHELLLKFPEDVTFMARANWLRDFGATHTTGYDSSNLPLDGYGYRQGLTDAARKDLRFKGRILDFWVAKSFELGGQQARLRLGKQAINWGESLFAPGGINATNPFDVMRLAQPGTQLKEGILPTPAISFSSGLGGGLNMEAYLQTHWEPHYMPPSGSYWSVVNGLGRGQEAYGATEKRAKNSGQWGLALKYRPPGSSLDLGLYALNYHDKTPQMSFASDLPVWRYPENRRLYGASANFALGDWAIGTELSYRPREAVSLNAGFNPVTEDAACGARQGQCWVDEKKLQWHLTGLYSLTPGNSGALLDALGASSATFMSELVIVHFPTLKKTYDGIPVAAGGWGWNDNGMPVPVGTKTSSGASVSFSWTYDGSLIPGWQVTPEVFYSRTLGGRTPTVAGTYMRGAQSANFALTFTRNPATWQFGLNYAKFWGGDTALDNPIRDRDFLGAYAQFNF